MIFVWIPPAENLPVSANYDQYCPWFCSTPIKILPLISIAIDNPSDTWQRIDKFLRKYLPNAPLWGIFKWLRTGKIKVNNKKVDQTYRTLIDDEIAFYFTEAEMTAFRLDQSIQREMGSESKKQVLQTLYEDSSLLIINKPPALNVHPSDHKSNEASLIELVQDMLWDEYNTLSFKPSLVHRIDRDTSGCIMIAKEKKALEKLLSLLQEGKIKKTYHTIVIGYPTPTKGTINTKLLRIENAKDEAKVRVDESWQKAITHYEILEESIMEKYCLLECSIETGRTHQIRVHLSSIGCPILWDKSYGNAKENSFARRQYNIGRQLLHAYSLTFPHPVSGKSITVLAPYMKDMDNLLQKNK
jgi:23S rRNA pseudouridine955/2504/2580 synthase